MIKVRDKPTKFEQIPRTHIFAASITLYTELEWGLNGPGKTEEKQHFLQKIGPNKAMTLDKSKFVYFASDDVVLPCTIVHKSVEVKQAS